MVRRSLKLRMPCFDKTLEKLAAIHQTGVFEDDCTEEPWLHHGTLYGTAIPIIPRLTPKGKLQILAA